MSAAADLQRAPFDVEAIRKDFPCLHQMVNGKPLIYLDNAATSQVPQVVVDALVNYHTRDRANIHRGVHELSQRASAAYDLTRGKVAGFLGVADETEVVLTRGTTDSLNLVAASYGGHFLKPGDEVVISAMEHHSNIVPWQLVCERTGAVLRVIGIDERGQLRMDEAERLIGPRTKIVSVVHVSNALGTINPVRQLAKMAHDVGAIMIADGAQATPHMPVDVTELGCDFYAFSGHKVCGPSGVGALWGRKHLLEAMPPYQGGGDMILDVRFDRTLYNEVPLKFEAGTPNIAGVIGLGAAIDYLQGIGMDRIEAYEAELFAYASEVLAQIPGMRCIGTAENKASVWSFLVDGTHPTDVGTLLDQFGVAVRTGHHCTQPVMDFFEVSATARASFAFYNTREEVDAFADALKKVLSWL
jgi:cysteine desulfurase/selenocysteine lyase